MDERLSSICGWQGDLKADIRGEFWINREALTESERAMFRWGIVEEFNKGLEEILSQDQAVGEMREDLRGP